MKIRCRNCGLHHNTRVCPSYGPMFPAPGFEASDYEAMRKKIADRVAADVLAEHNGEETEEGEVLLPPRRKPRKKNTALKGSSDERSQGTARAVESSQES